MTNNNYNDNKILPWFYFPTRKKERVYVGMLLIWMSKTNIILKSVCQYKDLNTVK